MLPLKMLQTEDISDQNITFSATNEPLSYQTIRELVSNHTLFIIGTGLNQYWLPILVLAGLFGNTLSLMVMLLSHNRTFTTCLYLAALAVSDNILLILGGHTWIATVFKDGMVQAECTIAAYLFQTISTNSTWLLVVMTADKCISIVNPLSKHQPRWRPVEYTPCIIGSVFATSVFCNIPYIFSAKVHEDMCVGIKGEDVWLKALSWFSFTINCILPFLLLATMNTLIICAIRRRTKELKYVNAMGRQPSTQSGLSFDSEKERQLSVTLLLVTFTFLLLTSTQYIRHILFTFWDYKKTVRSYALGIFIYHLGQKLNWTNAAVNLLLYCAGGSRFRTDLCRILGRRRRSTSHYV